MHGTENEKVYNLFIEVQVVHYFQGRRMEEGSEDKKVDRLKAYQAKRFGLYPKSNNDLNHGSDAGNGEKRQIWEISIGRMDKA